MKYSVIMFFILLSCLPAWGQLTRKSEIEKCTKQAYSAKEFRRIADSMQLTIEELSDYPVIFPIKKPSRISSGFGMRYHPIYKTEVPYRG